MSWTKHGALFPNFETRTVGKPWSKSGAILTTPLNGQYYMYFGDVDIYYATSTDLIHWMPGPVNDPTDMIASPNYARLVYDGDHDETEAGSAGPPGSGVLEHVFERFWAQRGMASENIPFDGRSDYVGFVNRGIPSGGIFAGAEAPKPVEQVALYGGVEGEQLDPCYHEPCDNIATVTGQPPAETMNVFGTDPVHRVRPTRSTATR